MSKTYLEKQNGAVRNSINFIRNVASPQPGKSQHGISSKYFSYEDPSEGHRELHRNRKNQLGLLLFFEESHTHSRLTFDYQDGTCIKELTDFIKKSIGTQLIYLKTQIFQLQYLLTLPNRKVTELKTNELQISIQPVRVLETLNYLKNFQILKCIGTGGFSNVYLARGYGQLMALKVISKSFIIKNDKRYIVENQRFILAACEGHPFITKLFLAFQTANYLIFCMEYCNGGELFNLLRRVRKMREDQARFYFQQTLAAITHLHNNRILYRDLKPENIILDADGHIRLADYGLSKQMDDSKTYSFCGSAEYMAPEMLLKKGHSFEIDYYCLGALLYELVYGLPPYYSQDQNELFSNIINKQLTFPSKVETTPQFKNFVSKLLEKDINQRFKNTSDIFNHPWLQGVRIDKILAKELTPPFKTNMHSFNIDDSQFGPNEIAELQKIKKEKEQSNTTKNVFENFIYQCPEVSSLKRQFVKVKLNFTKNKIKPQNNGISSSERSSEGSKKSFGINTKDAMPSMTKCLYGHGGGSQFINDASGIESNFSLAASSYNNLGQASSSSQKPLTYGQGSIIEGSLIKPIRNIYSPISLSRQSHGPQSEIRNNSSGKMIASSFVPNQSHLLSSKYQMQKRAKMQLSKDEINTKSVPYMHKPKNLRKSESPYRTKGIHTTLSSANIEMNKSAKPTKLGQETKKYAYNPAIYPKPGSAQPNFFSAPRGLIKPKIGDLTRQSSSAKNLVTIGHRNQLSMVNPGEQEVKFKSADRLLQLPRGYQQIRNNYAQPTPQGYSSTIKEKLPNQFPRKNNYRPHEKLCFNVVSPVHKH